MKVENEEKSLLISKLKAKEVQYLSQEEDFKKRIKDLEKSVINLTDRIEKGKRDYSDLIKERDRIEGNFVSITKVKIENERLETINKNLHDGKISKLEKDIDELREEKEDMSRLLLDRDNRVQDLGEKVSVLVERNKKYLLAYKTSLAKRKTSNIMKEEAEANKLKVLQLSEDLDLRKRKIKVLKEEISVKDALIAEIASKRSSTEVTRNFQEISSGIIQQEDKVGFLSSLSLLPRSSSQNETKKRTGGGDPLSLTLNIIGDIINGFPNGRVQVLSV